LIKTKNINILLLFGYNKPN